MHEKLKLIAEKVREKNNQWFAEHDIDVKYKGELAILNYTLDGKANEYNLLTRGLVINNDGQIVSFPFVRFSNEHISGEEGFDVLEKMDGTFVGLSFINNKPFWHTRKMISICDLDVLVDSFYDNEPPSFLLRDIGEYLKKLTIEPSNHTWMFEYIGKERSVITQYTKNQFGLYLIGRRNIITFLEDTEDTLDELAIQIASHRPRRWTEIPPMTAFSSDYEGFVLRKKEIRVKVKNPDYLLRHRLLGNLTYKTLLPLLLNGEKEEILRYFPSTALKFDQIEHAFQNTVAKLTACAEKYHVKYKNRKALALAMAEDNLPANYKAWVFASFGAEDIKGAIESGIRKQTVEKILELLGELET